MSLRALDARALHTMEKPGTSTTVSSTADFSHVSVAKARLNLFLSMNSCTSVILGARDITSTTIILSHEKSRIVFCRQSSMGERFIMALSTPPSMAVFARTEGSSDRICLDWRLEVDKVTHFPHPALHLQRVGVFLDNPLSTRQRQRPVDKHLGEVDDKIAVRKQRV